MTHVPAPAGDDAGAGARDGAGALEEEVRRLRAELTQLRTTEAEWRTLVEALPQIVWITRPDGWHEHFNRQWMEFTGLTLEESLGDGWNPPFHPDDRPVAWERWNEATETGEPYEIEYRLRRHDGVYHWMLGRALPLRDADGHIVKWFGTCTDIEDLMVAQAHAAELVVELERRADHDHLTGLANRDLLFRQLALMLRQRRRTGVAVAFLDLDRFKAVNDRYGHHAGDRLLVQVADDLRASVRQGDVAARIGGDEFVVVGEADDEEDAERFSRRLVEAIGDVCVVDGTEIPVAASIGVAYAAPGDGSTADEVLSLADSRMYRSKRLRYAPAPRSEDDVTGG
jgi:diguanylate cyclase (GGDEF)-like protein/PAS domain S-box-containing protein